MIQVILANIEQIETIRVTCFIWITRVGSKTLQALDDTTITKQTMETTGILNIVNNFVPRCPMLLIWLAFGRI